MDPLSQLRDIHLPEPIGFWPPAIGWWGLALVILALLCGVALILLRWRRKTGYRRQAEAQLKALLDQYKQENNPTLYSSSINSLLKQVSVTYYKRKEVAKLSAEGWLTFLDRAGNTTDFTQGPGRVLATAPYGQDEPIDGEALYQCCAQWIRKHR